LWLSLSILRSFEGTVVGARLVLIPFGNSPDESLWDCRSVDQSISPLHQFSVESMFAPADAQEMERLLDEAVRG